MDSCRVFALCCAGPVGFKSENGKESSDEAFLQLLTQSASGRAKGKKAASPTFSALTRLQLEERDVAKVGEDRWQHIFSLGASSESHSAALFWAGCIVAMAQTMLGAARCLLPCITNQLDAGSGVDMDWSCICSADDKERHRAPGLPSQQLCSRDCGS